MSAQVRILSGVAAAVAPGWNRTADEAAPLVADVCLYLAREMKRLADDPWIVEELAVGAALVEAVALAGDGFARKRLFERAGVAS